MAEDDKSEAEIEREIREGRKFTPQEALARMAGPGAMKGASAVSPQQQAENAIGAWLNDNIDDCQGSLRTVLHRHISASKFLLDHIDDPLATVAAYLRRTLSSDAWLRELVREADVHWGRAMDEPPHFEREGSQPHADDPYTVESVRNVLAEALQRLSP